MDEAVVSSAVAEVQLLVSGDGARLDRIDPNLDDDVLRLRLDLSRVECLECVLPPELLAEIVTSSLRRRVGDEELSVLIEDPRRPAPLK